MTNKTVKDAVEHFGGFWPYNAHDLIIVSNEINLVYGAGKYDPYDSELPTKNLSNTWCIVCTKQQFEDYVKEQKMERQKYKYVDAGIKTVGELYDRIDTDDNGCFVGDEQLCIIVDGCSISFESTLNPLSLGEIKKILRQVTTRQPLPWYEQEGLVFPCIGKVGALGVVRVFLDIDGDQIQDDSGEWRPVHPVQLLTVEEIDELKKAAKYGVDV